MTFNALTPAYGRDYKSKEQLQAAVSLGKDFLISNYMHPADGRPVNAQQLIELGYRSAIVRYGRLRKVAVVKLRADGGVL